MVVDLMFYQQRFGLGSSAEPLGSHTDLYYTFFFPFQELFSSVVKTLLFVIGLIIYLIKETK